MISFDNFKKDLDRDETRKSAALFQSLSDEQIERILSRAELLENNGSFKELAWQLLYWGSELHPFEFAPDGEMTQPVINATHPPLEQFLDVMDLYEKNVPHYEDRSFITRVTKPQVKKLLLTSTIGRILIHSRLDESIMVSRYDRKNCFSVSSFCHDHPTDGERAFLKLLLGLGLIPTNFYYVVKMAERNGMATEEFGLFYNTFYLWYETSRRDKRLGIGQTPQFLSNGEKEVLRVAALYPTIKRSDVIFKTNLSTRAISYAFSSLIKKELLEEVPGANRVYRLKKKQK